MKTFYRFIFLGFVIVLLSVSCLQIYNVRIHPSHYFNVLGIKQLNSKTISEIIQKERYTDVTEKDNNIIIKCKGYEIIVTQNNNIYLFNRIEVYEDMYRFTWRNIGINSTKSEIEKTYSNQKKIKDLKNNQVGYIVDDLWIQFQLTENNIVEKITLFYGP